MLRLYLGQYLRQYLGQYLGRYFEQSRDHIWKDFLDNCWEIYVIWVFFGQLSKLFEHRELWNHVYSYAAKKSYVLSAKILFSSLKKYLQAGLILEGSINFWMISHKLDHCGF